MLGEMAKLSGRSLIGFREGAGSKDPLYAHDPTTGQQLQPGFIPATLEEVDRAVRLAADAFRTYSHTSGRERATTSRATNSRYRSCSRSTIGPRRSLMRRPSISTTGATPANVPVTNASRAE